MNRLRIATWNIHKGIGPDRRYDLQRTLEVLREIGADVVTLQEVDEGCRRSDRHKQADILSKELGYPHWALGLNVAVNGGHYGNLTLSRHPFVHSHNLDVTFPLKKRRSGLVTRLMAPGGRPWTIVNVHLGLMHLERRHQLTWILDHLIPQIDEGEGVVIAGDWNDWWNRLHHPLASRHKFHIASPWHPRHAGHRTWPSRAPIVALDKILYREPIRLEAVERIEAPLARRASDHLPLVADLALPVVHKQASA